MLRREGKNPSFPVHNILRNNGRGKRMWEKADLLDFSRKKNKENIKAENKIPKKLDWCTHGLMAIQFAKGGCRPCTTTLLERVHVLKLIYVFISTKKWAKARQETLHLLVEGSF